MSPSPIRYHRSWKIQKRQSEPDRWLDEIGYYRKHTAKDSSCLFRAVSESVYKTQRYYHKVRKDCVKFMAANRHLLEGSLNCPFENYLTEMSTSSEWGGFNEIIAMSHLYRRDFVIFNANKGPKRKICNDYGNNIFLFHIPENKHFDIVYTKEFIVRSSFCQSIMYEILYEGVYQIKDISYAIEKMLHDKISESQFEYFVSSNEDHRKKQKEHTRERSKIFIGTTNDKDKNNNEVTLQCKHYTEDGSQRVLKESLSIFVLNRNLIHLENVCVNCLDVNSAKDLLDNNIIPFPYKVAKALDPDIYRNIEFDVWSEWRRELRFGARYSDGTTLQVGVKCLCKLQSNQTVPYHCHIQEMRPDRGPCLVFIEEIGEKHVVNYEQLQPLPSDEVRPWAPPYRYSRAHSQFLTLTQMLKHIGNVSRKQSMYKRNKCTKDEPMNSGMNMKRSRRLLMWKKDAPEIDSPQQYLNEDVHFTSFLSDSQTMPLEAEEESLVMVDCRQVAGAPPQASHEAQQMPTNGSAQPENQTAVTTLAVPSGEMNAHVTSQSGGRASTPAAANTMEYPAAYGPAMGGGAYLYGGMKPVMWCAPPHVTPPPGVNTHVYKSIQANGSDLPMNDIPTLRFYFNLGVDCMWSPYGAPPPPRFPQGDLVRDMQSLAIQSAPKMAHDKPPPPAPKTAQRPVIGPRFKRGPHHEQKTYANKGANNRRNSHDGRPNNNYTPEGGPGMGGGECVMEPPMVTLPPYISYPPPVYPMPYYQVEADPCMMGGVSYMPYEEGVEYGAPMPQYYPPPQFVPHAPPPQVPHPPQGGERK